MLCQTQLLVFWFNRINYDPTYINTTKISKSDAWKANHEEEITRNRVAAGVSLHLRPVSFPNFGYEISVYKNWGRLEEALDRRKSNRNMLARNIFVRRLNQWHFEGFPQAILIWFASICLTNKVSQLFGSHPNCLICVFNFPKICGVRKSFPKCCSCR